MKTQTKKTLPKAVSRAKWQAARNKLDRKSTRLNSSHLVISYAVFCLKKKKVLIQPAEQVVHLADLVVPLDDPVPPRLPSRASNALEHIRLAAAALSALVTVPCSGPLD